MSKGTRAVIDPVGTTAVPGETSRNHNAVLLAGRLAGTPVRRELPSGDTMVHFRLVVRRTCDHGRRDPRSPTVDTIDCASWSPECLGDWETWSPGDMVSLAGCLRRRFWRAGPAVASRYEVEVHQATCFPLVATATEQPPVEEAAIDRSRPLAGEGDKSDVELDLDGDAAGTADFSGNGDGAEARSDVKARAQA